MVIAMVSNEVQRTFEEFKKQDDIKDIENYYSAHRERCVEWMEITSKPEAKLGQNGFMYLQLALYRSKALMDGILTSIESRNPLTAFLSARAQLEVTAAVGYFLRKLQHYYDGSINSEELDTTLAALHLGERTKVIERPKQAREAINVITMIQNADKAMKESLSELESEAKPAIMGCYEMLSEYCHPNFSGISMSAEIREKEGTVQFADVQSFDDETIEYLTIPFRISMPLFFNFYDEALDLLIKNETIPETSRTTSSEG